MGPTIRNSGNHSRSGVAIHEEVGTLLQGEDGSVVSGGLSLMHLYSPNPTII